MLYLVHTSSSKKKSKKFNQKPLNEHMNYYNKVNMRKVEQNENDVTITVIFIVLNMTFTFIFVTLGTFKPSLE